MHAPEAHERFLCEISEKLSNSNESFSYFMHVPEAHERFL